MQSDYQGNNMVITNYNARTLAGMCDTHALPGSMQTAMMLLYKDLWLVAYIQQELKIHLKKKGFLSE